MQVNVVSAALRGLGHQPRGRAYAAPPLLLAGSPVLDIDATFLIYLVVFATLMWTLQQLVFRPVMTLLDARREAVEGASEKAEALSAEADAKMEDFERQVRRVRSETTEQREKLRSEGVRLERTLTDKVRAETEERLRAAETEMQATAAQVRRDVQAMTPKLAAEIAEKLLGREVQGREVQHRGVQA